MFDRYSRQMRFPPLGKEGQEKLARGKALVVGCGALGSVIANTLARAGVGYLKIIDRDFLELNNLQRQVLYDETDVAAGLPKAIAAKQRLEKINSEITIDAAVADIHPGNIEEFVVGMDVIVDGTDNFETRFLLNDVALKHNIPWVYGGCLGAEGQTLTIIPGQTPCLRCLIPEPPPPGSTPTCDAAGILGPIINVIGSLEATEAMKILAGKLDAINRTWIIMDVWDTSWRSIKLDALADRSQCPVCSGQEYAWLAGERTSHSAVLCGRNAVQLSFPNREDISLEAIEEKLISVASEVSRNRYLVRAKIEPYLLTIFTDGRAVIGGTEEIAEARSIYAKYLGN